MQRLTLSLRLLLTLCVGLAACNGAGTGEVAPAPGNSVAANTVPAGPPSALLAALPPLDKLPAPARHAASEDYQLLDSAPVAASPAPGCVAGTGSLALTPPADAAVFAVYGQGGLNADGSAIPAVLKATAGQHCYYAVSDYASGRWRFLNYLATGNYALADGASLVSPAGNSYVAVVGFGPATALAQLQLTTNQTPAPAQLDLWYYLQANLQVDANRDAAIAQLQTAAQAGYTKVLYADSKLEYADTVWDHYIDNLTQFKAAADAAGIEVVPNIVSPGYANGLLTHDPNLIEGQPVTDAVFQDIGGTADVVQDPATHITNGDFEAHSGDSFSGWNQMDGPGASTFADTGRGGTGTSIRFGNFPAGNASGNDRIQQTIAVKPWQCYSVNFWLKTDNPSPLGQLWARIFSADSDFRTLTEDTFEIAPTQDWTQYHLIFNSQDKTSVYLYLGIWGGQSGTFWIDDVDIENAGLINLIRRPGAPFKVTSLDGSVTYAEGVDYTGASDPLMGQNGYQGNYDLYHARPTLTIPPGSAIHSGDQFKVNYYHATFTDDLKPACDLREDGTFTVITDVLTKLESVLHPQEIMVGMDEHRVAAWSAPSLQSGFTSGQEIAEFSQRCQQIVHGMDPNLRVLTWSDMYDPEHNEVADYYLARGGTLGADAGLPASWDVANWNSFNNVPQSLAHFAQHGNRQVLSAYYDQGAGFATNLDAWLDQAKPYIGTTANGAPVTGVMYTTWVSDYSQLAPFATAVRAWEAAQ
jgi:hypothetical protein